MYFLKYCISHPKKWNLPANLAIICVTFITISLPPGRYNDLDSK